MTITSIELKERQAVVSLLNSPGWVIFQEKIKDLLSFEENYITNLTKNCIKAESLHDLNFHLSKRQVLQEILMMKDALEEEFSPNEDGVHNTSRKKS